ncbi:uncharacterized protein LOC126567608 [Anopheles maculipalpis]|uniref:uncharacterized protein LOC126567608 n=1 Tax=Anopheles maculipalpis TaxID=1496333 RepID=UPI002158A7A0|nr:uncharacterized protein LOC126567608 [Anopheles maculipalpis]
MTVSVSINPIADTKCTGEYSYAYYGYDSSSAVSPRCVKDDQACSTYIRGQIHARRINNGKIVPLMVGMMCMPTNVAIYTKITKYREWIIRTLKELGHGDAASTHGLPNPGEFVESSEVKMEFNSHTVKILWPENGETNGLTCYGAHTDPGAVITLAQCTSYLGNAPTEVMFYDSSVRKISEIIVHPNYTRTEHPNFNDIAVLKLESPAGIIPAVCGWYGNINPSRSVAVNAIVTATLPSVIGYSSDTRTSKTLLIASFSEQQCNTAQYDRSQIPNDSRDKYFCFLHNPSDGQKSYKIQLGAPIQMTGTAARFVVGLNQNNCDCGFSTPMIGIRFDAHEAWLKSILLPTPTKPDATKSLSALTYIDNDITYSDPCGYPDGTKGMCEAIATCSSIQQRVSTKQQIVFCGNQTIVCCPQEGNAAAERFKNELIECDNHYSHLRQERHERLAMDDSLADTSPHLVRLK